MMAQVPHTAHDVCRAPPDRQVRWHLLHNPDIMQEGGETVLPYSAVLLSELAMYSCLRQGHFCCS